MLNVLFRLARLAAIVYVVVCLVAAGCQSKMLYFPKTLTEDAAVSRAAVNQLEPWRDAGGKLIGWTRPGKKAPARLLVFHGNAGFALDRTYYVDGFGELPGAAACEVFLLEYPGYGPRPGSPGKDEFIKAGRAAVQQLLKDDSRPLYLLGESIGSGPAAALAGEMPEKIAGAVMMIPFARLAEVAQAKLPWLPVSLLMRDKFDNIEALSHFKKPVVFVIAEDDEVIGAAQGRKLHDAYAGPKKLIVLPGASHNNFPTEPGSAWYREAGGFLRR